MAFLILFTTALYFRSMTLNPKQLDESDEAVAKFVDQKKTLACALTGVYVLLAIYSFTTWSLSTVDGEGDLSRTVFFLDFFTFLILSDIVILLVSYKHITDFPQAGPKHRVRALDRDDPCWDWNTRLHRCGLVHSLSAAGSRCVAVESQESKTAASRPDNVVVLTGGSTPEATASGRTRPRPCGWPEANLRCPPATPSP